MNNIVDGILNFNKRYISRAISHIESESSESKEIFNSIYSNTGNAYRIGVTGPPGAGKSTLTNKITLHYSSQGKKVGIIAVDPTSPFTGGALLGDRVRMTQLSGNENVFIRSMATRGSLGGLSRKATDVADILDAAGFDIIIFETVGVGQSELDIANAADTTMVVLVPESGDSIQAMKAGLMEIGDLFIMNKSDRPGSDNAVLALRTILQLNEVKNEDWNPLILQSIASENTGIEEIIDSIEEHKNYLLENNQFKIKRQLKSKLRIMEIVESLIYKELWDDKRRGILDNSLLEVVSGNISPYLIAENIISKFKEDII